MKIVSVYDLQFKEKLENSMKYLFVLMLLMVGSANVMAANLVEAFYSELSVNNKTVELLISVYDDGTCSTESDNGDGRKFVLVFNCEVTKSRFTPSSIIKESNCNSTDHFNGLQEEDESLEIVREKGAIIVGGLYMEPASKQTVEKYKSLTACEHAISK